MKITCGEVQSAIVRSAVARPYSSTSSIFDVLKKSADLSKRAKAKSIVEIRSMVDKVAKETGLGKQQISQALAQPSTLGFLKAFGYSVKTIYRCVSAAGNAVHNGVMGAMEEVSESTVGQKLTAGTKKMDEILDKHPILKKATGPVVAGLLAYQWFNMSYIGEGDLDFDVGYIGEALAGKYKLVDVLASPDALSNMAYVGALIATGGALSFPYLISDSLGVGLAIAYSAAKHSDKLPGMTKLKKVLKSKLASANAAVKTKISKPKAKTNTKSVGSHWWDKLSKEGKQAYLKEHPGSALKLS